MGNEGMSAGHLLKQANQLKRAGRLDEAIAGVGLQVFKCDTCYAHATRLKFRDTSRSFCGMILG